VILLLAYKATRHSNNPILVRSPSPAATQQSLLVLNVSTALANACCIKYSIHSTYRFVLFYDGLNCLVVVNGSNPHCSQGTSVVISLDDREPPWIKLPESIFSSPQSSKSILGGQDGEPESSSCGRSFAASSVGLLQVHPSCSRTIRDLVSSLRKPAQMKTKRSESHFVGHRYFLTRWLVDRMTNLS
jgi:hypothetical protein